MKKFLLAGVALTALAAANPAVAADLPVKAPLPPVMWNWTGFYLGPQVGAMGSRTDFSDPYGAAIFGDFVRSPGFLAGGQIGYNWQAPNSPWVFGIEADANAMTSDGTNTCFAVSSFFLSSDCHVHPSATATLTGRVGHTLGADGRTLVYAKGGLAWVHNNLEITVGGNAGVGSGGLIPIAPATAASYTKTGGTIGAGVERALSPAWSLKFEYDYLRFGGVSVTTPPTVAFVPGAGFVGVAPSTTSVTQDLHEVKLGLNYHFGANPGAGWPVSAPAYPVKALPIKAPPPSTWAAGWEYEGGSRIWYSTGKFAWSIVQPSPISRLTYDDLRGPAGELFSRVDTPWNLFIKGNVGIGKFKGKQNDEDWNGGNGVQQFFIYGNTLSEERNGKIAYGTTDVGYDVLRGPGYKVGPFIGYNYFTERSDTYGCAQIAPPGTGCIPTVPTSVLVGTQDSTWQSLRVGLSGETMLADRLKLAAEVAYLPYVTMTGRDNHLLRPTTTYFEQSGTGRGVQLEALLSYLVTDKFSVGIGGRYWAMWTTDAQDQIFAAPDQRTPAQPGGVVSARFDTSRFGVFGQASYKFDWLDFVVAKN